MDVIMTPYDASDEEMKHNVSEEDVDPCDSILEALQVDSTQVEVTECMTVNDLYWYHFEQVTDGNNVLFQTMLQDASMILNIPISGNDTITFLSTKLL